MILAALTFFFIKVRYIPAKPFSCKILPRREQNTAHCWNLNYARRHHSGYKDQGNGRSALWTWHTGNSQFPVCHVRVICLAACDIGNIDARPLLKFRFGAWHARRLTQDTGQSTRSACLNGRDLYQLGLDTCVWALWGV